MFRIWQHTLWDQAFEVVDLASSVATPIIAAELNEDVYGLKQVQFQPGDLILDIGAHVGMFSLICGRYFPQTRVVALEPFPQNVQCFKENMCRNGITNVELLDVGISGDGLPINLQMDPTNTGGTSAWSGPDRKEKEIQVPTVTLNGLYEQLDCPTIQFLKMDCEGMEYVSLMGFDHLKRVKNMGLEAHTNAALRAQGFSIYKLKKYLESVIGKSNLHMMTAELKDHLMSGPGSGLTNAE